MGLIDNLILGFCRFMAQFLGYAGINYSSPTLSTAMLNLIPAFTFVLAVIFRLCPPLFTHTSNCDHPGFFFRQDNILNYSNDNPWGGEFKLGCKWGGHTALAS